MTLGAWISVVLLLLLLLSFEKIKYILKHRVVLVAFKPSKFGKRLPRFRLQILPTFRKAEQHIRGLNATVFEV